MKGKGNEAFWVAVSFGGRTALDAGFGIRYNPLYRSALTFRQKTHWSKLDQIGLIRGKSGQKIKKLAVGAALNSRPFTFHHRSNPFQPVRPGYAGNAPVIVAQPSSAASSSTVPVLVSTERRGDSFKNTSPGTHALPDPCRGGPLGDSARTQLDGPGQVNLISPARWTAEPTARPNIFSD